MREAIGAGNVANPVRDFPAMSGRRRSDERARVPVTPRESEVLSDLGARLTNAEIASRLCISERTVESHVSSLLRKLGAANRRELAAVAQSPSSSSVTKPSRPAAPPPPVRALGAPAPRETIEIPHGVRELIGLRIDRLPDDTQTTLSAGAVVGRDFAAHLLADMEQSSVTQVVDRLQPAVAAGLVDANAFGHFTFEHRLVQDLVYERLTVSQRAALHHRAGCAIESVWGHELETHLAELAYHFERAADGDPRPAVRYLHFRGRSALG
jgi:DNA-binding CsgD family transcriptional regulator